MVELPPASGARPLRAVDLGGPITVDKIENILKKDVVAVYPALLSGCASYRSVTIGGSARRSLSTSSRSLGQSAFEGSTALTNPRSRGHCCSSRTKKLIARWRAVLHFSVQGRTGSHHGSDARMPKTRRGGHQHGTRNPTEREHLAGVYLSPSVLCILRQYFFELDSFLLGTPESHVASAPARA